MNPLWLLLIPYTTAAYGIHGGEGITGVNRQVRNLICALPFALVAYFVAGHYTGDILQVSLIAALFFVLAYLGVNLGFADLPGGKPNFPRLALKGFVNFPPLGALLLPLAYYIGYETPSKNVFAEYFSGTLYGIALASIAMVYS